jgi:hypothetical protein
MKNIVTLAMERPLVYLPSHDPESELRLAQKSVIEHNAANFLIEAHSS